LEPPAGVLKILVAAPIQAFRRFDICASPCFAGKGDSELLPCTGEKKTRIPEMRSFNARHVFGATDVSRMSASD
jgi:hypothetical protein